MGFPLLSIRRWRKSGHSNARGCLFAVLKLPRGLKASGSCVDAKTEAEGSGGQKSPQTASMSRAASMRSRQHRSPKDRRPRMALCTKIPHIFLLYIQKTCRQAEAIYNKGIGAYKLPNGGNPLLQTHCCGFSFPLDSSTAEVRPQQCPGLSVYSFELPPPEGRMRPVNAARVEVLLDSMRKTGLLQPLVVGGPNAHKEWPLVDGAHRKHRGRHTAKAFPSSHCSECSRTMTRSKHGSKNIDGEANRGARTAAPSTSGATTIGRCRGATRNGSVASGSAWE